MRRWILMAVALLATAACDLDLTGFNALNAAAGDLAAQLEVHEAFCDVDSLSISMAEVGRCASLNADSTYINFDGIEVPTGGWSSSNPNAISITLDGWIRAEAVVDTVWIRARGTNGTSDSVQVWTY